jgi:hypothetical protein
MSCIWRILKGFRVKLERWLPAGEFLGVLDTRRQDAGAPVAFAEASVGIVAGWIWSLEIYLN